jgi:hypothetical protein
VNDALAKQGIKTQAVERWKAEMPTEEEMLPKDKYTIFDRKERKYRKGIHSELLAIAVHSNCLVGSCGYDANRALSCRVTQVDESFAATESSWVLRSFGKVLQCITLSRRFENGCSIYL